MIGGQVKGFEEALDALQKIVEESTRADVVATAALEVGKELAQDIAANAPRDDTAPHMADSFGAVRVTDGEAEGKVQILVGPLVGHPAAWRAKFPEFGTSKQPAQPYARPVADENEPTIPARVIGRLLPVFERIKARYERRSR